VSRGRLGVAVQAMNQTLANSFGMKAARRAGQFGRSGRSGGEGRLAAGRRDSVGERRAGGDSADLPSQVAGLAPGSSATVQVWRDKAAKD
jgi:serine protease Do